MPLESKTLVKAEIFGSWERTNPVVIGNPNYWPFFQYSEVNRSRRENPRWRQLISLGQNATTPYEMSATEHSFVPGNGCYCTIYWSGGAIDRYKESGCVAAYAAGADYFYTLNLPSATDAQNIALGKFLNSIRNAVSPFKGLTFLGELRESISMIKSPLKHLRSGLNDYVRTARNLRKRRLKPKPLSKAIAGTWLEYVYGWSPLLADIKDGVEAFGRLQQQPEFIRVFGSGDQTSDAFGTRTSGVFYPEYLEYLFERRYVTKVGVRYVGAVRLDADHRPTNLELLGFRWEEFIPTVWELIPYSFLVDYFTNLGDLLGAAFTATSNVAWHARSTRIEATARWSGRDSGRLKLGGSAVVTRSIDTGSYQVRRISLKRDIPSLSELPSLVFQIPGIGTKWLNIAALATMRAF